MKKGTVEEERAAADRIHGAAAELNFAIQAGGELGLRIELQTIDVTRMGEKHRRYVVEATVERVEEL